MKEFKFKKSKDADKLLTIKIDGRNYTFNPLSYNVKKASEKFVLINKTLLAKSEKKDIKQEELDKIIIQACDLVRETINKIIGKNTYEQIFRDRTISFNEQQEVMTYIFECITEFSRNIVNEHTTN